jgi:hypothetical protein
MRPIFTSDPWYAIFRILSVKGHMMHCDIAGDEVYVLMAFSVCYMHIP